MSGYVYFLGCAEFNRVKIGHSQNPDVRLQAIQSWMPVPLDLLAKLKASKSYEYRFHKLFEADWSHSEWFYRTPAMDAVICRVENGASAHDLVGHLEGTPCHLVTKRGRTVWTPGQRKTIGLRQRLMLAERRAGHWFRIGEHAPRCSLGAKEFAEIPPEIVRACEAFIALHPPKWRRPPTPQPEQARA